MKALCWYGKKDVRVREVKDPEILNPHDIILRITLTAICGSDLHLYDGFIPTMEAGDILGHEFMGIVVETGSEVRKIQKGDRVVVPFTIACGQCYFCSRTMWACCDNTNPNATMAADLYGFSPSGLFGYSHMLGGYAGGQAEYVRVPFGDVGAFKVPESISDEKALFVTDIFPTGFMAAENCNIERGDTVAVWGCGPVGMFCIWSAYMLGAERVIAIDNVPERLTMARQKANAETINFNEGHVVERLTELTGGRGPDSCIDAVGMEAHGLTADAMMDTVKTKLFLATDKSHALREAIMACRKGGTVSIPGVYGGLLDKFPLGAAHAKGLTLKMGQTHVHRYIPRLLEKITENKIDPSVIISHRLKLSDAAAGYKMFLERDGCTKVVMTP